MITENNYEVLPIEVNSPQWLELRKQGIGGSDAAIALGLSKWKTPYQLWLEKTGKDSSNFESEAMYWGKALEPVIRQRYADITGNTVNITNAVYRSKQYPFMMATIDGETTNGRLLEIKTTRYPDGWGESGTDEIPHSYLVQVQHYLAVRELPVADIAVLIGGQDCRLYEVEADKELIQMIIDAEAEFWEKVQKNIEPELTNTADVLLKYRTSKTGSIQMDENISEKLRNLKEIIKTRKDYESEEDSLKAAIQVFMGENDTLLYSDTPVATWKSTKAGSKFNTDAFKLAHPELYNQFLKETSPQRRFLIK